MTTLAQALAESGFPLFGLHPRHWPGAAFLGTVARHGVPARLELAQLVYLDEGSDPSTGIAVSNGDPARESEPLERHLGPFAARFDERFVPRRLMRRAFAVLRPEDFTASSIATAVAGMTVGAELFVHRGAPLRLLRTALRAPGGVVDVGVAGWSADPVRFAALLEPVNLPFAGAFDLASASPEYPPSEWGGA